MNARVLITKKCFRGCKGCCNDNIDIQMNMKPVFLPMLTKYDSITLTGGEPMQEKGLTTRIVKELRENGYDKPIYLYTSFVTRELYNLVKSGLINGVTFTMHDILYKNEKRRMTHFSNRLKEINKNVDMRFKIEERIIGKHARFINAHIMPNWNRFESIEWYDDGNCPIIEDELLVLI